MTLPANTYDPFSEEHLRAVLKFGDKDLEANRLGNLSYAQEVPVASAISNQGCQQVAATVYFCTLPLILIGISKPPIGYRADLAIMCLFPFLGMTYAIAIYSIASWLRSPGLRHDPLPDRVTSLIGPVSKRIVEGKRITYELMIWDHTISVSWEVYNAFAEGRPYRIYREDDSGLLLSAEFVTQTRDDDPNAYLRWALDFGFKDLEANKQGWTSERQQKIAREKQNSYGWSLFLTNIVGIVWLGIAYFAGEFLFYQLIIVVVLCGLVYSDLKFLRECRIWRRQYVASVHGLVIIQGSSLLIGGQRVSTLGKTISAFIPGRTYRVYYLPHTVLSAEYTPLDEA